MGWTVETLSVDVDAEIEDLPADMRARFAHISRLIEEFKASARTPLGNALEG